jgi:hypothetical protein
VLCCVVLCCVVLCWNITSIVHCICQIAHFSNLFCFSFCLHNFAATVTIAPSSGSDVLLVPHPVFDGFHFSSLEFLNTHSTEQVLLTFSSIVVVSF